MHQKYTKRLEHLKDCIQHKAKLNYVGVKKYQVINRYMADQLVEYTKQEFNLSARVLESSRQKSKRLEFIHTSNYLCCRDCSSPPEYVHTYVPALFLEVSYK